MKVSIFLMSFGGTYCAGSKPFTSPAMRVGNALASKCVIGPMPLLPATTFCQAVATSLPTGEMMPRPVTTTRRLFMGTPDSKTRFMQAWDRAGGLAAPVTRAIHGAQMGHLRRSGVLQRAAFRHTRTHCPSPIKAKAAHGRRSFRVAASHKVAPPEGMR